ncbi:sensor histidine kinase [Rickettsiales endosymbiont of Stachyamoeba lipophora]|uniref:sensor histidine kinase n=1 Tax=Rickettsiales endosymbiont of Stachyamoeba lipophora TaxID=2486578 RepID=UPI000F64D96B|nr:ATP-binding protein [Rickettsiales endosymbiont of Stachyamoeba lipophora]AZL15103.1 sensor histidine kinase [Rickettsiales endosymbiont of Stachyamoeba lipophora]
MPRFTVALLVFLTTFMIAFLMGAYLRDKALSNLVVLKTSNQFNNLSDNFNSNIWNKIYEGVLKETETSSADKKVFYPLLEQYFYLLTKNMDFKPIAILTKNGAKVISNNGVENIVILPSTLQQRVLCVGVANFKNHDLLQESIVKGKANLGIIFTNQGYFIHLVTPLIVNNQLTAFLDGYYNITGTWNFLFNFQIIYALIISVVITAIFVILGAYSAKLQSIIVKQIQTNEELELAKVEAEKSSRQKSQFLANMSHELRTPLNAIIGFSEIIKTEALGAVGVPQYKEYGNDIHASGTHLLSIINDILDFSKADADKLIVENIQVDATKMVKQCLRIMIAKAQEAKVNLSDLTADKHFTIFADPKRLKQVILNVLSNSVKFTPENGTIEVSLESQTDEGKVQIVMRDSGIGIEAKDIAKVLSPFGQVDSKHARKYDGTGLGLPLSKKLVELMNGKFHIDSEVGIGTTVKLTFNLASD